MKQLLFKINIALIAMIATNINSISNFQTKDWSSINIEKEKIHKEIIISNDKHRMDSWIFTKAIFDYKDEFLKFFNNIRDELKTKNIQNFEIKNLKTKFVLALKSGKHTSSLKEALTLVNS